MPPLQMKRDATPNFSKPSLCKSCRRGMLIQGIGDAEQVQYCNRIDKAIRFKVAECTEYDDKSRPALYDMRETAFYLMTNKGKVERSIGFMSPQEYRKQKEASPDEDEPLKVPPGLPD